MSHCLDLDFLCGKILLSINTKTATHFIIMFLYTMQSSSLPIVERSSPVSIGTVHYTQAAAVAVAAAGMVSQAQVTSSPQLLTSGPVAQAVVLPYTHALPPQGGPPAQLQPSAYLPPAAYNYVQQVSSSSSDKVIVYVVIIPA